MLPQEKLAALSLMGITGGEEKDIGGRGGGCFTNAVLLRDTNPLCHCFALVFMEGVKALTMDWKLTPSAAL